MLTSSKGFAVSLPAARRITASVALPSQENQDYWDAHYSRGGRSGEGSVGWSRKWKWRVIESYILDIDDVVDIGCGDLDFWEGRDCKTYFGLDVSPTVVSQNRLRRPHWKFQVGDARNRLEGVTGRVVFCLDLLFHIMDDAAFESILRNISQYSTEWAFIFTWWKNPFSLLWRLSKFRTTLAVQFRKHKNNPLRPLRKELSAMRLLRAARFLMSRSDSDGVYQKYRKLDDYAWILTKNGLQLVGRHTMPFGFGAMYVFRAFTEPAR